MRRVDIIVFEGVDEIDALGPLEVFRSAARLAGELFETRLVSRTSDLRVQGAFGLRFEADCPYEPGADVMVVPGGGWVARAERGAWGELERGELPPMLAEAAAGGALMAGVCTGTMLLAGAGIVGSRRATTHRAAWADLEATGATLVRERVVDDGDLVTSGGVTSGLDLALWLVERLAGFELAEQVGGRMEYPRFRPAPAAAP